MSKRVQITHECDECRATADRADTGAWVVISVSVGGADQYLDACSKRCARLLLIKMANAELRDDP